MSREAAVEGRSLSISSHPTSEPRTLPPLPRAPRGPHLQAAFLLQALPVGGAPSFTVALLASKTLGEVAWDPWHMAPAGARTL